MSKIRWIIAGILFLALALPVGAQTKQVITNGGFETDTTGWTVSTGALSRTTTVVHTGSGSGQLDLADTGEGLYAGEIHQCIDLSGDLADWPVSGGGKQITFSGMFKTDAGGGSDTFFWIQFWATPDCNNYVSGDFSTGVTNQDWTEDRHTMEIPATAQSVRVWVIAESTATTGPVYVDELRAFSSTPTAVTVQSFSMIPSQTPIVALLTLLMVTAVYLFSRRRKRGGYGR